MKNISKGVDFKYWFLVLLILNLISITLTIASFFQHPAPNFAYVDGVKLVTGYRGMELAKKELEVKSGLWKANLDTLQRELETSVTEYAAAKSKLTLRERTLTEELIKSKQDQFLNYQEVVSGNLQKADLELSAKVLAQVNDYIKRYGESKGLTIIFAATQQGNIAYANKELDLTEVLLKGLNEEFDALGK
ncbi:MAG: OmpH family outer membrane protein [Cyclobacteriaceae bacterium]|nr:OmpH family outer membrane protein [Cyclobacteriaceae bacterium]